MDCIKRILLKFSFNTPTLWIQINILCTFINFGYFSQQYVLIWNRTFIRFESMRCGSIFAENGYKQKVSGHISSNSLGRFFSCIFILIGIAVILQYVCLFGSEYTTLPPLNFPTCTLIWTCTFIVFAIISHQYAYLDPYVYLDP